MHPPYFTSAHTTRGRYPDPCRPSPGGQAENGVREEEPLSYITSIHHVPEPLAAEQDTRPINEMSQLAGLQSFQPCVHLTSVSLRDVCVCACVRVQRELRWVGYRAHDSSLVKPMDIAQPLDTDI